MTVGKPLSEKLKRAYPNTPASFDARMRATLGSLPARRPRRIFKPAAAILLAAALVMCGLAYAASQSHLLEKLFHGDAPTPQAELLLTQLGAETEKDGVTLTIDEYLLDGADLYVNWTVTSRHEEPLMLMMSDLETAAAGISSGVDSETDWIFSMGVLLDAEHPSYSSVSRYHFDDSAPAKAFDVTLTAALLRTVAPILSAEDAGDFTGTPTLLASFDLEGPIPLSAVSELRAQEDGAYSMSNDLGEAMDGEPSFDAMLRALDEQGYATEALRLPVQFTVVPDEEHIVHTEIVGARTFRFDKFTLTLLKADFTAAGVNIRYRIVPSEPGDPWNTLAARLNYEVHPNGQAGEWGWSQSKSVLSGAILSEIDASPSSAIPDWVRLMPYDEETLEPMPQYAVDFRLRTK